MVPIILMGIVMDGDGYLWDLRLEQKLKKIIEEREEKDKARVCKR